ncbi:MAG: hypothetical protein Q4G62_01540 [Pseudomonadota bacterium]|nr:hypothetical protein [Pseudomonadota bacterium]
MEHEAAKKNSGCLKAALIVGGGFIALALLGVMMLAVLGVVLGGSGESKKADTDTASIADDLNDSIAPASMQNADQAKRKMDADLVLTLEAVMLPNQLVRLEGATNLPPQTKLMLSVTESINGGFSGQSSASVGKDGRFASEDIGPANGLKPGKYLASVVMPIPQVQPESVRRIIGENGEHLTGALLTREDGLLSAEVEAAFIVGGADAVAAQAARDASQASEQAEQYAMWEKNIASLHDRLQAARSSGDQAKWGDFARSFTQEHRKYQDELMEVQPMPARFVVAETLDAVRRMFHATAFDNPKDFSEAASDYKRHRAELKKLISASKQRK